MRMAGTQMMCMIPLTWTRSGVSGSERYTIHTADSQGYGGVHHTKQAISKAHYIVLDHIRSAFASRG
jgi:hypothetical protein